MKQHKKIEMHVPTELKPAAAPQPDVVMEIVTSTQPSQHLGTQSSTSTTQPASMSDGSSEATPPVPPTTEPFGGDSSQPDSKERAIAANDGTIVQDDQNAATPRFISQAELDAGRLPQSGIAFRPLCSI